MNIDEELMKRMRLRDFIIQHRNEEILQTTLDAVGDLLADADMGMVTELLSFVFDYSDYWPERLAKQALCLNSDHEYSFDELLAEFEQRELGVTEYEDASNEWVKEGF